MSEPTQEPQRLRVVVADDQAAVREPLAAVLGLSEDIDVVAAAADGSEVLTAVAAGPVDVVLMDLRMPVMDGIETTRRLGEDYPDVAVVVLTTFADDDSILGALGAGARGYLTKNSRPPGHHPGDPRRCRRAVRARPGGPGPAARHRQNQGAGAETDLARQPHPREREVFTLIGQGLPNRGIAEKLFVSEATVKTHINNLFAKAGIRDRADAVRRAIEAGLA